SRPEPDEGGESAATPCKPTSSGSGRDRLRWPRKGMKLKRSLHGSDSEPEHHQRKDNVGSSPSIGPESVGEGGRSRQQCKSYEKACGKPTVKLHKQYCQKRKCDRIDNQSGTEPDRKYSLQCG